MNIKSFLKLVEIQTKLASLIPFLLGSIYAVYRFGIFNVAHFFIMLISLLCVDMATTAINNYCDYKSAIKKYGYNYESHNAIVRYKLKIPSVLASIFILMFIAITFGILLVFKTNIIVFILGSISFCVGILYSFGPVPISRTPLGEFFSGFFMGFVILFLSTYIHVFDENIVHLICSSNILSFTINIPEILYIILFSVPTMVGIANIMLANNICDIEDDIENKRYTLPVYIGGDNGIFLFKALYFTGYASIFLMVVLGTAPLISLLALLTIVPVGKNISLFSKTRKKETTFVLSVKNFVLMSATFMLTVGVGTILNLVRK